MSVVTAPPNLVRVPPPAVPPPAPVSRRASTRRSGRRHQNDLHLFRVSPPPPPTAPEMLPPGGDVITYTYRFGAGGRINRQPLDPASPPPSAGAPPNSQETSPVCTNSSGTSPEGQAGPPRQPLTNSPASPPPPPLLSLDRPERWHVRSALRVPDNTLRRHRKTVQWFSDTKRKVNRGCDRKAVKYQVNSHNSGKHTTGIYYAYHHHTLMD